MRLVEGDLSYSRKRYYSRDVTSQTVASELLHVGRAWGTSSMSGNIFISYRRSDSAKDARALYERLRREFGEGKVFIDLEGIEPGEDFVESLERQLDGCEALVALISRDWVEAKNEHGERRLDDENDFVRVELAAAFRRSVKVFPVLIDGARPPRAAELPEDLHPLVRRQAVVLDYSKFDADVARLARAIRKALEHPTSAHEAMPGPEPGAAAGITKGVPGHPTTAGSPTTDPAARAESSATPTGGDRVAQSGAEFMRSPTSARREGDEAPLSEPIEGTVQSASVSEALPVPTRRPIARTLGALTGAAVALLAVTWLVIRPTPAPTTPPTDVESRSGALPLAPGTGTESQSGAALYEKAGDYLLGRNGAERSDSEAVKLLRMAAEQGNGHAQSDLGFMYAEGRSGLPKSDSEALKWYRMSAEQGNPAGQVNLGLMYETGGGGLPKSDSEAVKWYRMAAEQGYAYGQASLGLKYEQGRGGLSQSDSEAVKWYRMAAEQGDAMGQTNLGIMYQNGRGGLTKSDSEAVRWTRMAAEQGDRHAQENLGGLYRDGRGVPMSDS